MPAVPSSSLSTTGAQGPDAIALRPVAPDDAPFLRSLFFEERRGLFAPIGLAEPLLSVLLEQQYRAHEAGCAGDYPQARRRLILVGERPVGRLTTAPDRRAADTLRIVDIVIAAAWRGRGIGGEVLTRTARAAADEGWTALALDVAHTNPSAERLYLRLGFRAVGGDAVATTMERPTRLADRA